MHFHSIHHMYDENPKLHTLSYHEQMKFFKSSRMVHFNHFADYMTALGNEAIDILYDFEQLQKAWAKENGIKFRTSYWQQDIFLKQLEFFKPDIVYLHDTNVLPQNLRAQLKSRYSFIKLVAVYRGTPLTYPVFSDVDIVFAGIPLIYDHYKKKVLKTHLLYHSFDDSLYPLLKNESNNPGETKQYDFTFAGSSGYGYGSFQHTRYWRLRELLERSAIEVWLDERTEKTPLYHKAKKSFPKGFKQMQPLRDLYPKRCHKKVFGFDMYRILHHSKITFNCHTDTAIDNVGNMRLFEAAGVGTCLLTDTGRNMPDLFVPDKEVVTYNSTEECLEKLNYLLEDAEERKQIAQNGRRRILKDHTLEKRCFEMHTVFNNML